MRLLKDAFTDEDLTNFCFDRFPAVHDNFAQGMSKGQKVQMLLEYCVRHHEVETLLEAVRVANPAQYERYEATIRPL